MCFEKTGHQICCVVKIFSFSKFGGIYICVYVCVRSQVYADTSNACVFMLRLILSILLDYSSLYFLGYFIIFVLCVLVFA